MILSVLAFGAIKDIIGASMIEIECNGCTVGFLKASLEEKYPRLKHTSYMIAVNNRYAALEIILAEDDNIALIPHVYNN